MIASGTGTSTAQLFVNGIAVFATTTAGLDPAGVKTLQLGNETKRQAFTLLADQIGVF